jgi:hypothetical protein
MFVASNVAKIAQFNKARGGKIWSVASNVPQIAQFDKGMRGRYGVQLPRWTKLLNSMKEWGKIWDVWCKGI